jgi:hypothetical protein
MTTRILRTIKESLMMRTAAYAPAVGAAPKSEPPKSTAFGGDISKLDAPVFVFRSSLLYFEIMIDRNH